jgi:hypothetical protein
VAFSQPAAWRGDARDACFAIGHARIAGRLQAHTFHGERNPAGLALIRSAVHDKLRITRELLTVGPGLDGAPDAFRLWRRRGVQFRAQPVSASREHAQRFGAIAHRRVQPHQFLIDGCAPQTFKTGDVSLVPAGIVHNGRNTGSVKTTFVGTYVVESGKPLSAPAK